MNAGNQEQFAMMMMTVGEIYGKEVSPQMIASYFKLLAEFDVSDVASAFNLHIKNPDNGQFWPKPADLIRMIDGNTEARSMKAWSSVRDAVSRVGAWRTVCFDEPIIHLVIADMGGWPKLCEMKESEEPFVAKEFEKRYRAYATKGQPTSYPSSLLGIADQRNAGRYAPEPIAFIGDKSKAEAVLGLGHSDTQRTQIKLGDAAVKFKNQLGVSR